LRLARDLKVSRKSIEYNVVGVGHEFWVALEANQIIALAVVARPDAALRRILYLHVSESEKNQGIGSALIRSIIEHYPESEFAVTAFDGTESFYRRLGFVETSTKWEMRRPSPTLSPRHDEAT
jgi:predicted N-acetyltransferase YhbS